MKLLLNICTVVIVMVIIGNTCDNEVKPGCFKYTGKILSQDCPFRAVIEVTNQDIGDTLTLGNTIYENLIVIVNNPQTFKDGDLIYFNIDTNSDLKECGKSQPCPAIVYLSDRIKTRICISNFSATNCSQSTQ